MHHKTKTKQTLREHLFIASKSSQSLSFLYETVLNENFCGCKLFLSPRLPKLTGVFQQYDYEPGDCKVRSSKYMHNQLVKLVMFPKVVNCAQ